MTCLTRDDLLKQHWYFRPTLRTLSARQDCALSALTTLEKKRYPSARATDYNRMCSRIVRIPQREDSVTEVLQVESWDGLLREIQQFGEQMSQQVKSPNVWFRGVSKSVFRLVPSLFRFQNGKSQEKELFDLYTSYLPREKVQNNTDWDTLFDMQHYGVPTRLLDWTESLGVALFFALQGSKDDDPCVYLLCPELLNGSDAKIPRLPNVDRNRSTYRSIYLEHDDLHESPKAVTPRFANSRLQRQHGHFTIHGESPEPLERQCPECVRKIHLLKDCKLADQILANTNVNAYSLFPDFEGIAKYIVVTAGLLSPSEEWWARQEVSRALRDRIRKDADRLTQNQSETSSQ